MVDDVVNEFLQIWRAKYLGLLGVVWATRIPTLVTTRYLNIQNVVPPKQLLKINFFFDAELQISPIVQHQRL